MYKLLLVATDKNSLSDLASALLTHGDVDLSWADSGSTALNMISTTPVDLLVTEETLADMSGLELANKLLHVNPMINCAAVSPLSHKDFHEASEGLGLLAQLPLQPGAEQSERLLQVLSELKNLSV
ncbi:MAG: response regulator [Deltaproteobacteria bacterium]|nr:response regulator [Deltaproteobacteria bacterium]